MAPNGNDRRSATPRNPPWTRDETVLLLDLYRRVPKAGAHHSDVIALSAELNKRARRQGFAPSANFRNAAGIAMRLRNLARHDPEAKAGTGLRPGGAIDAAVWKEFAGNPTALGREVERIRGMFPGREGPGSAEPAFLLARIRSPAVAAALSYLLDRAEDAGFRPVYRNSRVKSVQFQNGGERNPFSVIANTGHLLFYLRQPALSSTAGLQSAAVARYGAQPENERREYRVRIHSVREADDLLTWLESLGAWPPDAATDRSARRGARLHAAEFDAVTADHLLDAARMLADGFTDHPFHQSTRFDVLFEDGRLPPKALFGMAASVALARPIEPKDFSAGIGTPCFRAIEAAGFQIVPKGSDAPFEPLVSREDREWIEGSPRLAAHLGRERGWGLAPAKRARFRAEHGKLFCERCSLDPVAHFGHSDGEACIEVHHRETAVADMAPGHRTRLEDLECLCANCHRVVHRELKRIAEEAQAMSKGAGRRAAARNIYQ